MEQAKADDADLIVVSAIVFDLERRSRENELCVLEVESAFRECVAVRLAGSYATDT